jgi:hypothetical protein
MDLAGGHRVTIVARMDPLDIERSRPAITGEAELGHPLIGPAGADGLAGRVARRMIVVAPRRAGLGIAARPPGWSRHRSAAAGLVSASQRGQMLTSMA